jgi:RNA polymerase sigma factor (sigma-70 family)
MNDILPPMVELFRDRRTVFLRVLTRRLGNIDEAEEILQEAFINFARAAKTQTISNPDGYLMQIALNLAVDRIRQDASRRRREESWFETHSAGRLGGDYIAAIPRQDQALAAKQNMARLARCLEELSPRVRTAFIFHKIKGLTHNETAQEMGLSKSTVEKHIMKAMKHVMENMSDLAP